MTKLPPLDAAATSLDVVQANIEKLGGMFPQAVGEDGVRMDVLAQLLGASGWVAPKERFGLSWSGKAQALAFALQPSRGTLRPCPEESVDWDTTKNLFIEGDNLEVLKLLSKSYRGQVKLIYIDPPYNTGKDRVYPDDYHDPIGNYQANTKQVDEGGRALTANSEAGGRFHTSWLNMLFPRLKLAKDCLADDGVIMVSIDDQEVGTTQRLLRELFGENNELSVQIWNKQHSQQQGVFKRYHEYVLVYAKRKELISNIGGGEGEIDAGALKKVSDKNGASDFTFPAGVRFDAPDGFELVGEFGDAEKVTVVEGRLRCQGGRTAEAVTLRAGWTQRNQMLTWFAGQDTIDSKGQKVLEFYFNGGGKLKCRKARGSVTPPSLLPEYGMVSEQTGYLDGLMGAHVFANPKPVAMLRDFVSWFVKDGELVMDFFAGSGTTGEGMWEQNAEDRGKRRFILVQLPEVLDASEPTQREAAEFCTSIGCPANIAELTKERLRRAGVKLTSENSMFHGDVGFRVFKLDSTNIRAWSDDPENLDAALLEHEDHLVPGRTDSDLLYEVLLKRGLDLCVPITERQIAGCTVHSIGAGTIYVCLSPKIDRATAEALASGLLTWREEESPEVETSYLFRDSAFNGDDAAKLNLTEMLKQGLSDRLARVQSI